ncbi:4655_t:CDS:2, partial [Cetraspora pellucida]
MSSSKFEESQSGDQNQTKVLIDEDVPHGGKKIDKYVLSPNMECIATLNEEDKSIVVWTITKTFTKDLIVKYDNSLNVNDLKDTLSDDVYKISYLSLRGISDCKHVIIKASVDNYKNDTAIIDATTKLRQILIAQGSEGFGNIGYPENIAFLENGDLVIVKGYPVYRAYIFSKSNYNGKYQWTCKNSIELEKFTFPEECLTSKKGKLFMVYQVPYAITQWDLITRKFDMQYILNWDSEVFFPFKIELNSDNTLLAVASYTRKKTRIYTYLTKSGTMIVD